MNILLISHCDFTGNSALHVFCIAVELRRQGLQPAICVPTNAEGVADLGDPGSPVGSYEDVRTGRLRFADGRGADLVHAFTPREHVRRLTEYVIRRDRCPYVVHLEDNERVILTDEFGGIASDHLGEVPNALLDEIVPPWRAHPARAQGFVAGAQGATVVVERLLELVPPDQPSAVVWPGFDPRLLEPSTNGGEVRSRLRIDDSELVLSYTGNIHDSNLVEVRSLYVAVAVLRRAGIPVRLVKTGWNHVDMLWAQELALGPAVLDLGWVPRRDMPDLLAAADVLVQPGKPDDFNDYRFPSKLPEFLVSGRPVVLPRSNIGLHLTHREEAILLDAGHAGEISEVVTELAGDEALRAAIGGAGRGFALNHLQWHDRVEQIINLYELVVRAETHPSTAPQTSTDLEDPPVKLVAFYLPQFHQIPENDGWWGEGFTEWTNVRRALPLFESHFQPQLPTELGFYDLRDPAVMDAQMRLARMHGVYGFCFYYYWFGGKRLLELPVDEMLDRGRPEFPFCFCWANENWTRRWDGAEEDVLVAQEYGEGWTEAFIRDLLPSLADKRYIRIDGAPLLLIYRASAIPDVQRATERWREVASREGLELHLAAVQSFGLSDPTAMGFDAAVEFPPHTAHYPADRSSIGRLEPDFDGFLEDYETVMHQQLKQPLPDYRWYRGVMPSWDNTARRGRNAHVVINSSPDHYRRWLRKLVLQAAVRRPVQEPLVFINAWNEWAEGTHLEPDSCYGRAWLEATRSALVDGVRQYHASHGLLISEDQADRYISATFGAK